jgi:signal-induced proliferation-associated 1 like protein 3
VIETGANPVYWVDGEPVVVLPLVVPVVVPVVEVPVVVPVVVPVDVPALVVPAVVVPPPVVVSPVVVVVPPLVVPELVAVVVEPLEVDVVVEPVVVPVEVLVPTVLPVGGGIGPLGIAELLSVKGPNRSASPSRFNVKFPLVALAKFRLYNCCPPLVFSNVTVHVLPSFCD